MNQKQIFADPEKKKLPRDLDSRSLEQISEEQEEEIEGLLSEISTLLSEAEELLNKIKSEKLE